MVPKPLPLQLPQSLKIVEQTVQVRGLHTFIRNAETARYFFHFRSLEPSVFIFFY